MPRRPRATCPLACTPADTESSQHPCLSLPCVVCVLSRRAASHSARCPAQCPLPIPSLSASDSAGCQAGTVDSGAWGKGRLQKLDVWVSEHLFCLLFHSQEGPCFVALGQWCQSVRS